MKFNVKQFLSATALITVAIISFILFAPILIFLITSFVIFFFILRGKIIKENPNFFKPFKTRKGTIIDQEEDCSTNNSKQ